MIYDKMTWQSTVPSADCYGDQLVPWKNDEIWNNQVKVELVVSIMATFYQLSHLHVNIIVNYNLICVICFKIKTSQAIIIIKYD